MQRLTRAVVAYGLLFSVLATKEVHKQPQLACKIEEFGVEERCHDCVIFHTQMLEDGVNLTARCGWPPYGSDLHPPSEFAQRSFSVGKRTICESCNKFYHRLLGGSPSFNLTENCGWQVTALIPDESSSPITTSCSESGTCVTLAVCCALLFVSNVGLVIYCCHMRRKLTQNRHCQRCLTCCCATTTERPTEIVVSPSNGSNKHNVSSDAKRPLLHEDNDRHTREGTGQSQVNGTSNSSTKLSHSSSKKKKNVRNRRRKTVP